MLQSRKTSVDSDVDLAGRISQAAMESAIVQA
jgi:hypothetical protein